MPLSHTPSAIIADELPVEIDHQSENLKLYKPLAEIRTVIAQRWHEVSDLLESLDIKKSKKWHTKILEEKSPSNMIRGEVRRILSFELETRAKAGRLLLILGEVDELAIRFQKLRAEFAEKNMGLVSALLTRKPGLSKKLPEEDCHQAGAMGVMRAADTWNPEIAQFSTYAQNWIEHYIRRAKWGGEKTLSLDKAFGDTEEDSGNLYDRVMQSREQSPEHSTLHMVESTVLREIIADLPDVYRRTAELQWLDGIHRNTKMIAKILSAEGFVTLNKGRPIDAAKVGQWVKRIERMLMKTMKQRFMKKRED